MDITFITSNPTKAEQLGRHINFSISHRKLELPEVQSLDLNEVIEHKAKAAYVIKSPALVEDFSLVLHALGNLPGPLIKWFWEEVGPAGVCKMLNNFTDRTATATVAFGLYDGKEYRLFKGEIEGEIAGAPRGDQMFASDAIFIPKGQTKTWSEMSEDEQMVTSIRRMALKQLEQYLQ